MWPVVTCFCWWSPSLEGFKSRVDPALRDLVELRMVSVRLMVGLGDLQSLFQDFDDPMIL